MIKNLLVAMALLAPALALAANPTADLSVQIVATGSTVPAPAQAAGFTTLALNADFSLPFYATQSNWLDCAGASNPQWYRAWIGFGSGIAAPCSAANQQTDPSTGQPALLLHWQDDYYNGAPVAGFPLQTVDNNGNGNRIPANAYFEVTARYNPSSFGPFANGDMWSYTADGTSVEWDGLEIWRVGASDASTCMHNNANGFIDCIWSGDPPNTPSIDWRAYHTYAWRVTSSGPGGSGFWCMYIDGQLQANCRDWHATSGELAGIDQTMQLLVDMACRGPTPPCSTGQTVDLWVKSVRIFSCAGVNSGAKCFTANPNP
jgi:hypothetical protein